ncbi:MAG: hypothetical protein ACRDF4_05460 [Rhabdochlamydiaceae bacterium]
MPIRHVTSLNNTDDHRIIDPGKIKHAMVAALRISELSGWIDPQTHLNLDFPEHLMKTAYIAEELEIGGRVLLERGMFMMAEVSPESYRHYGEVDVENNAEELKAAAFENVISRQIGNR